MIAAQGNLDRFGQVWTRLDKSRQVWTSLNKFRQVDRMDQNRFRNDI